MDIEYLFFHFVISTNTSLKPSYSRGKLKNKYVATNYAMTQLNGTFSKCPTVFGTS